MNKKVKILIIAILVIIVGFSVWRFVVAPKIFLGVTDCRGKSDGAGCTWDGWLDIWGRSCGGKYCYNMNYGICISDKCEEDSKSILKKYVIVGTDKSDYTIGEDITLFINNRFELPVFYDEPTLCISKKDENGEWKTYKYLTENREIITSAARYRKINAGELGKYQIPTQEYEIGTYKINITWGVGKTYKKGIWLFDKTDEFVIKE